MSSAQQLISPDLLPSPQIIQRGVEPYQVSFDAMRAFTDSRSPDTPDQLWIVEHPPVFTLGLGADPSHVLAASSSKARVTTGTATTDKTVRDHRGANGAPLTDPALVFAGTGGALTMTGAIRGTMTVVNENDTNDIPDAAFTWDGQQWHFNMATTNLSSATTYTFRINLAYYPASILFRVGLK